MIRLVQSIVSIPPIFASWNFCQRINPISYKVEELWSNKNHQVKICIFLIADIENTRVALRHFWKSKGERKPMPGLVTQIKFRSFGTFPRWYNNTNNSHRYCTCPDLSTILPVERSPQNRRPVRYACPVNRPDLLQASGFLVSYLRGRWRPFVENLKMEK